MPKLPPFALEGAAAPVRLRSLYQLLFFALFTSLLFALHLQLFRLPFFWDEQGQFIPTALDLLRTGAWVAHSTTPNVHPPGVELYLVVWYKLFGYSILVTRLAMLALGGAGLLFTFLLAIELSRESNGAPAFLPPLFLLASPLFYTQSMMAQLDMPAMTLTLLALLLFLKERYRWAASACVALVMAKETGLVVPAVFAATLLFHRDWKRSLLFIPAAGALVLWLLLLHAKTGYWLGNPGFAHYNVDYALNPVRTVFALLRRAYYLFFAEFRWIGTLVLFVTARSCPAFRTWQWKITAAVSAITVLLVSVLGGAELERYLLPVLPIFYIAVSIGLTRMRNWARIASVSGLIAGLAANLFWNPPYPFPFENNYAMVDFVRLQQTAAAYVEFHHERQTIATAWPFSAALESPDYGFVARRLNVIETGDFHASSIDALGPGQYEVLIAYTRTWTPNNGVIALPFVRRFLSRFYEWEPALTPADYEARGLIPEASWTRRGQEITVYVRNGSTF